MIVITAPTGQIGRQLVARLLDMSQQIGGALGVAILATIADSHTQTLLHTASHPSVVLTKGYDRAFLISAGFALTAAALTAVLIATRDSRSHSAAARSVTTVAAVN
jgi:hypothetical protein